VCCGALTSACRQPKPPTIRPHLARVTGVSAAGIDLEVQLDVFNPNAFPLAAEAVKGTLFLAGGRRLGEGSANPRSSIAADGSSLVACQVHVAWADVGAVLPLLMSERIPYELRGDVTLGGRSINVTLPFTFSGELDRAELLRAGLRGL
jgi:LEA14-like dessication related protein